MIKSDPNKLSIQQIIDGLKRNFQEILFGKFVKKKENDSKINKIILDSNNINQSESLKLKRSEENNITMKLREKNNLTKNQHNQHSLSIYNIDNRIEKLDIKENINNAINQKYSCNFNNKIQVEIIQKNINITKSINNEKDVQTNIQNNISSNTLEKSHEVIVQEYEDEIRNLEHKIREKVKVTLLGSI